MKPILYPATETKFENNGLGRLSDAVRCTVTEERNGPYELEMTYPITGRHYSEILEERILCVRHDDTEDIQPFRIYKITRPMNGIITIYARHLSYQLSKVVVMPFTANTLGTAMSGMIENSVGDNPFSFWTDKAMAANFTVSTPSSFRSLLGGVAGSILDVYGPGEYEWDQFTVKFHAHRGKDTAVTIRYGKNLTDVKKTSDSSSIWTGIVPYWQGMNEENSEENVLVTLPEKVIYGDAADHFTYRMVVPVDFSSAFQSKPTEDQLRSRAEKYVKSNQETGIPATIEISFVALWQTEEYQDVAPLQRLCLCDTVSVYHKGLGIETTAKIVSVTYDCLLERYEKMTVGDVKTSLSDAIRAISEETSKDTPSRTTVSQAISRATNVLSGNAGGNVMINTNEAGQPIEILVMDTASLETARNVLKMNASGISFSRTGYTGTYTVVCPLTGDINATYITAGILNAALLKKGILADQAANLSWNLATGVCTGKKVSFTEANINTLKVTNPVTFSQATTTNLTVTNSINLPGGYTGELYLPGNDAILGKTLGITNGRIMTITEDSIEEQEG